MIELGKIKHILVNSEYVTVQYSNYFNGGKFTQKRLTNTLINSNQDIIDISYYYTLEAAIKKVLKKSGYKIVKLSVSMDDHLDIKVSKK